MDGAGCTPACASANRRGCAHIERVAALSIISQGESHALRICARIRRGRSYWPAARRRVCGAARAAADVVAPHPRAILVEGWWEREHEYERARRRYMGLPPDAIERYNELQADINWLRAQRHEIDERIARKIAEQHHILGLSGHRD